MSRLFFVLHGRSSLERLARGLLLVGVFALAVTAYQWHFARLAKQFEARGTVSDALGVLSLSDRNWIREQASVLRRHFGLVLTVRVGGTPSTVGSPSPQAISVYFDPACRRSRVTVPPLVASALPEGLLRDLGREHLDAACRQDRAREGVLAVVGLLTTSLGEAASRGQGEGS